MFTTVALILSVILQFVAFFIAMSLIPRTKFNVAWISISAGFLLMVLRRLYDLYLVLYSSSEEVKTIVSSWIAVAISVSMVLAAIYIRKIFQQLDRINVIRKESQRKVLNAIVETEERERRHFSKELHDGIGPLLSGIKMNLSALNSTQFSQTQKEILKNTENLADSALISAKEISNHLNPHLLERFGLKHALQNYIDSIARTSNLSFHLSVDLDFRLKATTEIILFRVLCELINNSLRHASPKSIKLSVLAGNACIECMYEDDGCGFHPHSEANKGTGLVNMKWRIKSVGGDFELKSSPGKGMYAHLKIPE